jgi:hypothetical protein
VTARPAVRPALILGLTLLTALSSIVEAPSQLRLLLLLGFLTFLPGLSLLALFPRRDPVSAVAFAVGLSLALDLVVVTASMYSGAWSPANLLVVLLVVTFVVSGAQLAGGLGLVAWPTISLARERPASMAEAEPSFEGWYQVTTGPFKGMWTKSALVPQAELSPYPGLSPQLRPAPEPEPLPEPELLPELERILEPSVAAPPELAEPPALAERSAADKPATRTRILSITSPVSRGAKASVSAKTTPGAMCHLVVYNRSGPSRVAGAGDKQADSDGDVSWTWTIGTRSAPGTRTIDVICDPGGSTSATLEVR